MTPTRFRDETGLAGKILVGVVAWALGAVLLLTATLVNAQQIDTRVDRITHTVTPIDHNLDSVKLAVVTNRIAGEILAAAKPLSGQADQIVQATASIDGTAKSIDTTVGQIGNTVKDINGTAKTIGGTVNSIGGNVGSIGASVNGIAATLKAVLDTAGSIRGDHAAPSSGFGEGISAINRRADFIINLVYLIKGDTGNILATAKTI